MYSRALELYSCGTHVLVDMPPGSPLSAPTFVRSTGARKMGVHTRNSSCTRTFRLCPEHRVEKLCTRAIICTRAHFDSNDPYAQLRWGAKYPHMEKDFNADHRYSIIETTPAKDRG